MRTAALRRKCWRSSSSARRLLSLEAWQEEEAEARKKEKHREAFDLSANTATQARTVTRTRRRDSRTS